CSDFGLMKKESPSTARSMEKNLPLMCEGYRNSSFQEPRKKSTKVSNQAHPSHTGLRSVTHDREDKIEFVRWPGDQPPQCLFLGAGCAAHIDCPSFYVTCRPQVMIPHSFVLGKILKGIFTIDSRADSLHGMSSASSVCSSNDIDCALDSRIPPAIKRDVERFSMFISRLRAALDVDTNVPDGESMCVSVHAALEMVSESMRDLFKHPQFKTNHGSSHQVLKQLTFSVTVAVTELGNVWLEFSLKTNFTDEHSQPFMPLRDVFESSFDSDIDLVGRTKETTDHLKARVVEALDARRKEHDIQRGALKLEWTKLTKSLHDCEDMVEKCRVTLKLREEAVRKARENSLRSESITISPSMSTDPMKRRREMEKKKRIEEEAIIKKAEAEKQLAISSAELRRKRKELENAK
ncbi:hypothetical protein TELCIR_08343, partial [Teladorsagia circumcincta]